MGVLVLCRKFWPPFVAVPHCEQSLATNIWRTRIYAKVYTIVFVKENQQIDLRPEPQKHRADNPIHQVLVIHCILHWYIANSDHLTNN